MGKVNVAIVGAGGICNSVHLPSLRDMADVRLAAVCDLIGERARTTAESWGIPAHYTLMRDMLEREKIEALFCLVEPASLFHVGMLGLEYGCHVLLEKPPGILSSQAEALARKSEEVGRHCMVAFNRRYIPAVRLAAEKVRARSSQLTQVEGCFFKFGAGDQFDKGGLPAFLSDTIHAVDLLRFLSGGNEAVKAALIGQTRDCSMENVWNGVFEFENGVTGIIKANYSSGGRVHQFQLHGIGVAAYLNLGMGEAAATADILTHRGAVQYSLAAGGGAVEEMEHLDSRVLAGSEEFYKYYGYYQEDRHFIDCIKTGTRPESCIQDAVFSLKLTEQLLAARL